MKIKFIAAACIALCSSASFAATTTAAPAACTATAGLDMINKCLPEATLFIAGSSALGAALDIVVPVDLFDTSTTKITKIVSTTGLNNGKDKGWFGMSKAALTGGTSKRLFVVYNSQNGSAAGVSQLLVKTFDGAATTPLITESKVVSVGPVSGVDGGCILSDSTHLAVADTVYCSAASIREADLAISDVNPQELYKVYPAAVSKFSTLKSVPLALQGFGVAVSANLYAALQDDQGLATSAQPSIRRADYASLVTGSAKTSAVLFNKSTTPVLPLRLARRDDLSGTQASSNIFFADNACGINHIGTGDKAKLIANHLGGGLPIIGAETVDTSNLIISLSASGGDVVKELEKTGYGIGVISLNAPAKSTEHWKFVKLDGVSPNADASSRTEIANGNYPFAMTSFAVTHLKSHVKDKKALAAQVAMNTAVVTGLKDSTAHDLVGIAYLDKDTGTGALKQSMVSRTAGNNCSPLVKGL